jgi:hypothetical protein
MIKKFKFKITLIPTNGDAKVRSQPTYHIDQYILIILVHSFVIDNLLNYQLDLN